jgi:hypothetical protein
VLALSRHDEAVAEPAQTVARDKQSEAESLATISNVVLVTGGVLAAGGTSLLLVGLFTPKKGPVLDARVSATGAWVGVHGVLP